MAIFVVLAEKDNEALGTAILEAFPDDQSFKISDQQWLVAADKTAGTISKDLKVPDGERGRVAIFRLADTGVGWHKKSLWEWLAVKGEK